MTVTVLGSTGYTGMMLLRILADHPDVDTIMPVSRSRAGQSVRESDPGLSKQIDSKLSRTGGRYASLEEGIEGADAVLSALPHAAAADTV